MSASGGSEPNYDVACTSGASGCMCARNAAARFWNEQARQELCQRAVLIAQHVHWANSAYLIAGGDFVLIQIG